MNSDTLFADNLIGTILKQYNLSENNFHELVILYIKNNFHELVIFYTKITRACTTCPSVKMLLMSSNINPLLYHYMYNKYTTHTHTHTHINIYIYIFYKLGCPGQRSIDTRTSTNPRGTRNTLLARIHHILNKK